MAIIDTFFYNGEKDILRLHLAILGGHVDKFIICEAKTTFSGHSKPLYFFRDQRFFKPWWHQIDYFVVDEDYTPEEIALAESSPNTVGAKHWKREFLQKESIKKALSHAKLTDDDTVFIGDVDEIWDPRKDFVAAPSKILLKVYMYYLNNRSSEIFKGTFLAQYKDIKDACLNHLRSNTNIVQVGGWHFTWMGGIPEVTRKLNDSYTEESYNRPIVQFNIENCVENRIDILNRPFTYRIDESEWPEYLKNNRSKYKHLLYEGV